MQMGRYAKIIDNIDWGLLLSTMCILVIGLLCLYSATRVATTILFWKQLIWIGIGLLVMLMAFFVDYRFLLPLTWPIYLAVLLLLVIVFFLRPEISGARRWLSLGPIGVQPSELAKIMTVILVAYWGEQKKHILNFGLRELVQPFVILSIPVLLVLIEPDLGTAGIITLIAVSMLVLLGIKRSTLLSAGAFLVIALPFGWLSLKGYQRLRILSFLDPSRDPLGSGYHAMQSKIAVGSGSLIGKGFLDGTQTQLKFLPEHHTDFIFSVVAEEWGFVGSLILIVLFMLLITKIFSIGLKAKDRFGTLLCFGIAIYFSLHVFINIAMAIGIFPVVGVPLPFISYGGSFMLVNLFCIGLVLNISWRRFIF